MISLECPFCKNKAAKSTVFENTLFNNKTFEYKKCSACKLIYVQPFPNQEDYIAMYPPSYQGEIIEDAEYERDFNKIISLVEKHAKGKKILDFGCGNGAFLAQAAKKKYEGFGIEFDDNLIAELKKKHKNCRFDSVSNFVNNTEKFDVIHMSNVLEHLTNPKEVMEQLQKNLNNDGIFLIYGPIENNYNIALLVRKLFFFTRKIILKKNNTHAPVHIFYSNAKNQSNFFKHLDLNEIVFEINEQAWPFPSSLSEAKGLTKRVMFLIAKFSQFISNIFPKMGNIFLYVGKKNN